MHREVFHNARSFGRADCANSSGVEVPGLLWNSFEYENIPETTFDNTEHTLGSQLSLIQMPRNYSHLQSSQVSHSSYHDSRRPPKSGFMKTQ
jgi:hypothetical protein